MSKRSFDPARSVAVKRESDGVKCEDPLDCAAKKEVDERSEAEGMQGTWGDVSTPSFQLQLV